MHQTSPAAALAHAARLVRPGGVVAMMQSHLDALVLEWHSWPASAAYTNLLESTSRRERKPAPADPLQGRARPC